MRVKTGYSKSDTDGLYYKNSDMIWICEPDGDDPGILGPKLGVTPVSWEEAHGILEHYV